MSKEEVSDLAAKIESDEYKKAKPETPAVALSQDPHMHKIKAGYSGLLKVKKSGDTAEFKKAFRVYIDMLEELYREY